MKIKKLIHTLAIAWLAAAATTPVFADDPADDSQPSADSKEADLDAASNASGNYLSSQFARTNGNMDTAIRYLRRVHEDNPDNVEVATQLEGMLLLEGQLDEAANLSQVVRASDTRDPLADLLLTLREIRNDKLDAAAEVLDKAEDDGSVQLWVPLVAGWVDLGRGVFLKPLVMDNFTIDVGRAAPLINYHMALINSHGGFKDEAAKDFKAAIEDPKDPPLRIMKALLKFYEENDAPATLAPLVKTYLAAHPDAESVPGNAPKIDTAKDGISEVLYTMGGIMFGAGAVNDATIYLQLAVYIKPDFAEAVMALGDAYTELQQYDRANKVYATVAAQNPLYPKAQLHIAVNFDRMGKLKEALAALDKTIAKTSAPDALVTKGDLLRIHGRFGDAVNAYSQALKQIDSLQPEHWPILFARGSCLDRMGKWEDAKLDLEQALQLKSDQPDVLNYLGYGLLEHGQQLDEARAMIAKAVQARPNDPQIVDSMGWSLYLQGDYQHATEYMEKAVELIPGDPTVNDHLGDVYWRLGRKTEARFQWERALTFSPEPKMSDAIHKKLKDGLPPSTTLANTQPANAVATP